MAVRFVSRLEQYSSDDFSDDYVPDEREDRAHDLENDLSDLNREAKQPPEKEKKGAISSVGNISRPKSKPMPAVTARSEP